MRVYHGSLYIVEKPNLEYLNYKTDFGKGFYTTTNLEQAKRWANIKKKRYLKENNGNDINTYVNVYECSDNFDLDVLEFADANKEWLEFVLKNRESNSLLHDKDIVKGPVANDNLYQVLVAYSNGIYDIDETIKRLKTYVPANQISFHTEKALECLKYIETIEVDEDD